MPEKKSCENCRHVSIKKELHQNKNGKKVIRRLYCNEFHEFLKDDSPCDEWAYNAHLHKT